MLTTAPRKDPLIRRILKWADEQASAALAYKSAPGTTDHERKLLAAVGGLANAVSVSADISNSSVPPNVRDWWDAAPSPPANVVEIACSALNSGRDLFGELYAAVVSMSSRRRLGTVFTPRPLTAHMLTLCDEYGVTPATVIDPGAGVGAFTLDAAAKWQAPVIAVDLNVATLGFLAARCHLAGYETSTYPTQNETACTTLRGIHLVSGDFLTWLSDGYSRVQGPTLVIGNPPYTRHQGMDQQSKAAARAAAGPLITSGLAGMAAYFLAAALRHLRPSDALCMLLPSSWMHARYGREIRDHLWQLAHRSVRLDIFPHNLDVFPRAKVDAVVLFVGPEAPERRCLTVTHASVSSTSVTTARAEHIDRQLDQPRMFPLLPLEGSSTGDQEAELGESFRVHRGIATGLNAFFLLTDAEVAEHRLPESVLTPVVSSLRGVDAETLDEAAFERLGSQGMKRWLLVVKPGDTDIPEVSAYLSHGIRCGAADGFLARQRAHWFSLEDRQAAPLLLLPMTKGAFRVVRNRKGAKHTNSVYGLYPRSDDVDIDEAACWLRGADGQRALHRVARRYGAGMLKLEPRAVGSTRVPRSFGKT